MEVFLHLWDEIDDLASACRHVATSAVAEIVEGATPLLAAAAALGVWAIDGVQRHLLRLSA